MKGYEVRWSCWGNFQGELGFENIEAAKEFIQKKLEESKKDSGIKIWLYRNLGFYSHEDN